MVDSSQHWQPNASLALLKKRAQLYQNIRAFFHERNVLEVETPILSEYATIDPHIDSLSTQVMSKSYYLQTSPEFYLKRLLAAGSGDIYSLGKVFRQGEKGRRHQPEFTMLEWYRLGWDEQQLIDEVITLLTSCMPKVVCRKVSYRQLFLDYLDFDPHQISLSEIKAIAKEKIDSAFDADQKDIWLDLLMTHCIEPKIAGELVAIYDYPASQCALAKLGKNDQQQTIARRFEVYVNGVELANGYFELTDDKEQKKRFEKDCAYRKNNGLTELPYDEKVVKALEHGLPSCAGVAMGVDRLLMLMTNTNAIDDVMSFAQ
ncbi:MAG: EF-P lysine aminoacylase EpmA [Cellvibrionaceae bacterium]